MGGATGIPPVGSVSYGIYNRVVGAAKQSNSTIVRNSIQAGHAETTFGIRNYAPPGHQAISTISSNVIHAGTGSNNTYGIHNQCWGANHNHGYADSTIYNNYIQAGGSSSTAVTQGIYNETNGEAAGGWTGKGYLRVVVRNNIIDAGLGVTAYGIHYNLTADERQIDYNTLNADNDIIFSSGSGSVTCIQLSGYFTLLVNDSVLNNNLFNCTEGYSGSDGNIADPLDLDNEGRYNSGLKTFQTEGLDGSSGGLNWGFENDRDGQVRTGNGTTGWSIGCYEY